MKVSGGMVIWSSEEEKELAQSRGALGVWIIVADQRIARIFKKEGKRLALIGEALPDPPRRKITNRSVGRCLSACNRSLRHKYESRAAVRRQSNPLFALQLGQWLDRAAVEKIFERLVIIASPGFMGELRKAIGPKTRACMMAEICKEMTNSSEAAVQKEIEKTLWF